MKNQAPAVLILATLLLAACGGSGPGASAASRNELAATACEDYAKGKLEDKTYKLDHAALAASMKDASDGPSTLSTPITIEPGRTAESKQTLECSVRFVAGKPAPDVISLQFIWQ